MVTALAKFSGSAVVREIDLKLYFAAGKGSLPQTKRSKSSPAAR